MIVLITGCETCQRPVSYTHLDVYKRQFKKKLLDGGMAEDAATAASMVAASLQITAKGQPVIYYGEEIGLTGLNNYPYQTNRYDFDWTMVNSDNTVSYTHLDVYKRQVPRRSDLHLKVRRWRWECRQRSEQYPMSGLTSGESGCR